MPEALSNLDVERQQNLGPRVPAIALKTIRDRELLEPLKKVSLPAHVSHFCPDSTGRRFALIQEVKRMRIVL